MNDIRLLTVSDHIHLAMDDVEGALNSFTYPIFINAQNEKPDLIASSVVFKHSGLTYLVTASHVISEVLATDSPFYIGLEGSFIALEGRFVRSVSHTNDDFDIAFLKLSDDFVENNNINFVAEDRVLNRRNFFTYHLALIHGYPCSKNKQYRALKGGNNFLSYAFSYSGKIEKIFTDWDKYGKNIDYHTPMKYGTAKDINGNIVTPPSPIGMSGGGLWILPDSFKPTSVYLAGISIEYYKKEGITFSTKIDKVIEFIEIHA